MENTDIHTVLSQIGLSKPEIEVYLAALETGSRPAGIIAKRAGLKRGHTYNVLSTLMAKGIMQEFIKSNTRHFTCSSPTKLVSVLENRERELGEQKNRLLSLIEELEKRRSPLASAPKVRFFPGLEGVKEIHEDTIREENSELYGVIDPNIQGQNPTLWNWVTDWYIPRRVERGIWYNGIVAESPYASEYCSEPLKRRLRILPWSGFNVELFLYGTKVAFISHTEMWGVVLEDDGISTLLKGMHKTMWDLLPSDS